LVRAFEDGNGVLRATPRPLKCYRAAAEQGNATAQNGLGLNAPIGTRGGPRKAEAVKWYKKSSAARELDGDV